MESASGDLFTLMTHQPALLANDPPLQEVVAICGESDDDVSPGRNLARPGTGDGFEDFFETQRERLCRAIWMISGDRAEAEEVVQDAFMAVWERWDRVRAMDEPVGYLHRVAVNGLRRRHRRRATAPQLTLVKRPEESLDAADDRAVAREALRVLTPWQRAALVLTAYLGYSPKEAADMLGVKPSTVWALNFQARTALGRGRERGGG